MTVALNEPGTTFCHLFPVGTSYSASTIKSGLLANGTSVEVVSANTATTFKVTSYDTTGTQFSSGAFFSKFAVYCIATDDGQIDSDSDGSMYSHDFSSPNEMAAAVAVGDVITTGSLTDLVTFSADSSTTTEAGGTSVLTVKLKETPSALVVFEVHSSDTSEGMPTTADGFTTTTATLTFGPSRSTSQSVTMMGLNDGVNDGSVDYAAVLKLLYATDSSYRFVPPGITTNP